MGFTLLTKNLHKELNCVHNKKTLYSFVVEDWSADWKNFLEFTSSSPREKKNMSSVDSSWQLSI